ncbi:MAG: hypothetical protein QXZ66_03210 [Thermoproteota archaeon]
MNDHPRGPVWLLHVLDAVGWTSLFIIFKDDGYIGLDALQPLVFMLPQ